jgi:hypothetical protein
MTNTNLLKLALVQFAMMTSLTAFAAPQGNEKGNAPAQPTRTLLEEIVSVGFAPPGMTGQFRLQVKSDGSVVSVDNKGAEKKVSKLNPEDMNGVLKAVEKLQNDAQSNNDEPPCMDAPSVHTKAYQANGTERIISMRLGCRTFTSEDSEAYILNGLIDGLSSVQSAMRQLNSK